MKVGNRVDVHFTCGESLRNVEVVYMPCGMGDSWELKSTDGRLHRVLLFEMMSQLSESVEGVREQSGEVPSQQLKAKIRLSLEQIKGAALNGDKATMFSVINQTYAELSAL